MKNPISPKKMSFDAFVCKISDKFIVLQEKDVPDMSWLRGKLNDARTRGPVMPDAIRSVGAMLLLDFDDMIDVGTIRDIGPDERNDEKRVTCDVLSMLSTDKRIRRKFRSYGPLVERYHAVADYLGVGSVTSIRMELDALIVFPMPECTYSFLYDKTVAKIFFSQDANGEKRVVVDFGEKTWKLSYTVLLKNSGNVFLQFTWPDTDADSLMMKKKIEGLMTGPSNAIEVKVRAFSHMVSTNDKFTWEEVVHPVKCCPWTVPDNAAKKRPREPE